MPKVNGYEATKTLRKKGLRTPIVALTVNAMVGDDQKCISAGCDDYLAKPIKRKALLEVIRKYLSSESATSSKRIDSGKTFGEQPDFPASRS
jgi:CheY-like chemotaxis protein